MTDSPPRILVAEKDAPVRRFISHVLTKIGYVVTEVSNGPEALAVLASPLNAFDLVVIQEGMASQSGTAVMRAARAWGVESPAIIISGAMTEDARAFAAEDSRVRLLHKPLSQEQLLRTLFELLGSRSTG